MDEELPRLLAINIEVMVNSSQDCQEKRIATFSIEDLLQVLWIFYGGAGGKKEKKWSSFRKESIINQACIFGRLLRERQFNPSITFRPLLYSNLWGNMKGEISGWFTRTFSWLIDLVRMYGCEVPSVPKVYVFYDSTSSILLCSFTFYRSTSL